MTTALATTNGNGAQQIEDRSLLALVTEGDCGRLNDAQKLAYYRARCDAAGLDYRAQPFQFVKLNNKLVLYALKACSEQLSAKHGLSVRLVDTPRDVQELAAAGGCRAFTARVTGKDGRETDDVGVVSVKGASADALGNAIMKGATKAKRRAVLAHCGLGMLDETEIETIPRAAPVKLHLTDDGAVTVDGQVTTDTTLGDALAASVNREARCDSGGVAAHPRSQGVPGEAGSLPAAASTDGAAGLARGEGTPMPAVNSGSTVHDTAGTQSGQPLPPGPSAFEEMLAQLDEVRVSGGWNSKGHRAMWKAKRAAAIAALSQSEKATIDGAIDVCGIKS